MDEDIGEEDQQIVKLKVLKILLKTILFDSIADCALVFTLIAGVVGIIVLTDYNPYISAPLCIVFVFAIMIIYWKLEKRVSHFFNQEKK